MKGFDKIQNLFIFSAAFSGWRLPYQDKSRSHAVLKLIVEVIDRFNILTSEFYNPPGEFSLENQKLLAK